MPIAVRRSSTRVAVGDGPTKRARCRLRGAGDGLAGLSRHDWSHCEGVSWRPRARARVAFKAIIEATASLLQGIAATCTLDGDVAYAAKVLPFVKDGVSSGHGARA